MSAIEQKADLRRALRVRRKALPRSDRRRAAWAVARQFLRHRTLRRARRVALYLAMGSELDTGPLQRLLARRGVTVHAPRIGRDGLLHFVVLRGTRLRRHAHGMAQPAPGRRSPLRTLDLILLPLLGYDDRGQRLGQGGGYYDRTLARLGDARRPLRIGLAYICQRVPRLPVEPHDHPLHAVLTERGLRRFRITSPSR